MYIHKIRNQIQKVLEWDTNPASLDWETRAQLTKPSVSRNLLEKSSVLNCKYLGQIYRLILKNSLVHIRFQFIIHNFNVGKITVFN